MQSGRISQLVFHSLFLALFSTVGLSAFSAETQSPFYLDQSLPELIKQKALFQEEFISSIDSATLRPLYEEYIGLIGVNGIFEVIEAQACHGQGHELGKVIFAELNDLPASIHVCEDHCTSGCFHGILMELFSSDEHPTLEQASARINSLCYYDEISEYFSVGTCYHGLGHALMFLSDYNIEVTLGLCQQATTEILNYFCITGGFMEYELAFGKADMQTSLHHPCDTLEKYSAACYRYKMQHILIEGAEDGKTTLDIVNECLSLATKQRLGCFHGLGSVYTLGAMAEPALLSKLCILGDANDQRMCIEGAMWKLAEYDEEVAAQVCRYFSEDSEQQQVCFNAAKQKMYSLETDYSLYF